VEAPTPTAPKAAHATARDIRTILTHVAPGRDNDARLRAAAHLARRLDCTLYGLAAAMIPPLGPVDPSGLVAGDWIAALRDELDREFEAAEVDFRKAAAGLEAQFAAAEAMPADALARAARAADLILLGGAAVRQSEPYRLPDPAEVMLHAGRPVLIAPPEGTPLRGEAVVVAWKDTREARRALADALPFLKRAQTVVVTEVCPASEREEAVVRTSDVVAGLRRHDVAAEGRVVLAAADRVAVELNIAAEAIGADLVVAGGYGHTRLGEWVFGGVTRELLVAPERYVLLSH
jgi:nucleotide-binding universal stress UspA family protein